MTSASNQQPPALDLGDDTAVFVADSRRRPSTDASSPLLANHNSTASTSTSASAAAAAGGSSNNNERLMRLLQGVEHGYGDGARDGGDDASILVSDAGSTAPSQRHLLAASHPGGDLGHVNDTGSGSGSIHPPPDRWRLAYIVLILQGVAMMLPWNVFITAADYFRTRLFAGSSFAVSFPSYFSAGFMVVELLAVAYATVTQARVSSASRISSASTANAVIFALMVALVIAAGREGSSIPGAAAFGIVIVLVCATGATTALLQNALLALSARFPAVYIQGVLSGQALVGTGVAVASLLLQILGSRAAASAESQDRQAFAYFAGALGTAVLGLVGFVGVQKAPFYAFYAPKALATRQSPPAAAKFSTKLLLDAARIVPRHAVAASAVFVVTLALFPTITSAVRSTALPSEMPYFVAIHFVMFNVGDWVGRWLTAFESLRVLESPRSLLAAALARLAFVPLFFLSNTQFGSPSPQAVLRASTASPVFPVLITSDWLYQIIVLLFGITNGYVITLVFMTGPAEADRFAIPDEIAAQYQPSDGGEFNRGEALSKTREYIGVVIGIAMTIGLALGSVLSFGALGIACGCNPFVPK
ncbi:hypothetical protein GQ42DRAFT_165554 [Ramicandelaber brevisporus]|nr:hypothetical protein GQ42DRAFT_165554 [Ramicandelaber brevisporus]